MQPGQLLDRLLWITATLDEDMSAYLAAAGLTTSKAAALWTLHESGAQRQRDLADRLGMSARNVTAVVDALVESGHVARRPHPTDRRAVLVTPTERGARLLTELAIQRTEFAAALFGHLDGTALAQTDAVLTDLAERLGRLITHPPRSPDDH